MDAMNDLESLFGEKEKEKRCSIGLEEMHHLDDRWWIVRGENTSLIIFEYLSGI